MQTPHFERTLLLLSKLSGQIQYICLNWMVASWDIYTYKKINLIPWLIKEILDFHECCNLIGQEYIQICLITFNWYLWNIYQKTFQADLSFWSTLGLSSRTRPSPIDFFMDVYPHQKINFILQLFHEILDFQEPCILIGQEYLWQ